jgi:hypothetical protein
MLVLMVTGAVAPAHWPLTALKVNVMSRPSSSPRAITFPELGTRPFTFLGPVTYVEHRGERPVAFTWRLASPMPEELFEVARTVAAA